MIRGGSNLVEFQPVFSADGKRLLVCTGCTVSIYGVATGLLVTQLEGHTAPVTSVNIVQYNGAAKSVINHAWTSSLDGTIRFWDFSTGSLIKTVSVGRPIISMVIPGLCKPSPGTTPKVEQLIAFLLVKWDKETKGNKVDANMKGLKADSGGKRDWSKKMQGIGFQRPSLRIILHSLTAGKPLSGHLAKVSVAHALEVSQLGGLVGLVDNWKIWVWKVPDKALENANSVKVALLHHTKPLQALAFDPTETIVAGSDESGRILIWKNVGENSFVSDAQANCHGNDRLKEVVEDCKISGGVRGQDDAAALTTYHWHADVVKFLNFSADGNYLFSGGREAVLVIWQLETSKRKFLPRMGGPLLFMASSPNPSIFCISCADNTIKFVNIGTMIVERFIQGIKPPVTLPEGLKGFDLTRVAMQPKSSCMAMPADNMSLQFYDVFYDRHIAEVQISPRNYVPIPNKTSGGSDKTESTQEPVNFVTHVVFSMDATVMATAESRFPEEGVGESSYIKFWKQEGTKMQFSLNTRVDEPHSAEVSAFVYHPLINMVVSCSRGGDFKVWVQKESSHLNQYKLHVPTWRCRSVGSYRKKPMHSAAFSPDGTLLAVAAEEVITLWNPNSNGLVCVLSDNSSQPVRILSFVPKSHHLVTASWGDKPQLTVWSLETLSICWSYHLKVEALTVDPRSPHFAILATSKQNLSKVKGSDENGHAGVAVFGVENPLPLAIWNAQDISGAILFFLPPDSVSGKGADELSQDSKLIFMSKFREYVIFNPYVKDEEPDANRNKKLTAVSKQAPSAFEAIYGKAALPQVEVNKGMPDSNRTRPWGNFFDVSSHVLPPLTKIGFAYLESLLEKKANQVF